MEYEYFHEINEKFIQQWALLIFESPIICPMNSGIIGSKLDTDIRIVIIILIIIKKKKDSNTCRIAFYGKLITSLDINNSEEMQKLKIFKWKEKEGTIDRVIFIILLLKKLDNK